MGIFEDRSRLLWNCDFPGLGASLGAISGSLLVIGFAVCTLVYLYIALAGGIISREERRRKERESRLDSAEI